MLNKLLIAAILLTVALVTNGTTAAVATSLVVSPQHVRPLPAVPADPGTGVGDPEQQQLTEEFHQTYPLSATGRVNLANINGGVTIKVWDKASVQVDAIKKAYRKERLDEATIEVTATEENIRIKTEYPDETFRGNRQRSDNPATVDYVLTVPRKAILESIELINGRIDIDAVEGNVKASSINGSVTAHGLMGEAKLSTINGPLEAVFTQLDDAKPIWLNSINGNVTLIIPSNSNAMIRANTVHGAINNDFGIQVKHGEYVGHSLDGQIGTGGPKIKLENVNGAIHISHAQDGRAVSPASSVASIERVNGEMADDINRSVERITDDVARMQVDNVRRERVTREAQREAQKQVDVAMRESQREIEQAQREIEREARVQVRVATAVKNVVDSNARFTTQETKTIPVTGSPRVNITTFDGSVSVHGWDQAEVRYTATKRAQDEESLKRIAVVAEQQGQTISINATNDNDENGSVHLDVYVPRQSSLHVQSGDGPLTLSGVSGDITLRSGDGPIIVSDSKGQLRVNTDDGPIQINKFDGQVDARTGDGPIALDGDFNALAARTGDGQISLSVPAGSSFTIETNVTDAISNEGFSVAEDVTPSPRVKRWKIGNGGRIFVLKTGEGKILLRPRN
jgi:DUF4097 and DUF4098 domain-containing protein YvlB